MSRTGRVRPFAQVVLGLGQDNGIDAETPNKTNYYPYLAPGVGTDLAVHDRVSVRVRVDVPILMRYSDSSHGHTVFGGESPSRSAAGGCSTCSGAF